MELFIHLPKDCEWIFESKQLCFLSRQLSNISNQLDRIVLGPTEKVYPDRIQIDIEDSCGSCYFGSGESIRGTFSRNAKSDAKKL